MTQSGDWIKDSYWRQTVEDELGKWEREREIIASGLKTKIN